MKTLIHFICLVTALLLYGCGGEPWIQFEAKEKSFQIEFPSKPKETIQSEASAQGSIKVFTYESISEDITYTAGVSKYPKNFLNSMQGSHDVIFDASRDVAIKTHQGTLKTDKKGSFKDLPKRTITLEFKAEKSEDIITMTQVMILGKSEMYIIQTRYKGKMGLEKQKQIDRFHNSFAIPNLK